jgi:hypothetical protein
MPAKSPTVVLFALATAVMAPSASAKTVAAGPALDKCVLRGGAIVSVDGSGKLCCATDNNGRDYCVTCEENAITCDIVYKPVSQPPVSGGTKKKN